MPQFPCLKKVDLLLFASTKRSVGPFASSRGSVGPFVSPKGPWSPVHEPAQRLPQEVATFQTERRRHSWGSAGAVGPSLRACLEGTCEKHKLLGSEEILGEFCALQSMELCLDRFVLAHSIPLVLWITLSHTDPKAPQSQWKRPGWEHRRSLPGAHLAQHPPSPPWPRAWLIKRTPHPHSQAGWASSSSGNVDKILAKAR